jgi:hypothetical protein
MLARHRSGSADGKNGMMQGDQAQHLAHFLTRDQSSAGLGAEMISTSAPLKRTKGCTSLI